MHEEKVRMQGPCSHGIRMKDLVEPSSQSVTPRAVVVLSYEFNFRLGVDFRLGYGYGNRSEFDI